MRLVSLTVRNYRIHQDKTVHFDPALTVIGGPNESGKSTIVEAVHHALFLRSRIGGTVLESMQSQWHPGHPTVELTLESDGSTYTITKQFTGGASAVTTLARAGHDMLRGEEAEEAIHRILEADDVGGGQGVAKRLRLQWAHLWVWQGTAGDDPLPRSNDQATATRLRERLGRIDGGSVLESPLDGTVAQQILDQHAGRTRDDGLPRSGSPLASATTELAAAAAGQDVRTYCDEQHEIQKRLLSVIELCVNRGLRATSALCTGQRCGCVGHMHQHVEQVAFLGVDDLLHFGKLVVA